MAEFHFEKLKRALDVPSLASVILDSFSRKEIARFVTAAGCVYPGVRMETLDRHELALGWAEEAFKDPLVMGELVKALDRTYAGDLEKFRALDTVQIHESIKDVSIIADQNGIGRAVWLLVRDGRPEAEVLVKPFLDSVGRLFQEEHSAAEKVQNLMNHLLSGKLNKGETGQIRDYLLSLVDEKKALAHEAEALRKKASHFSEQNAHSKAQSASREREWNDLKTEMSRLRRDLESKSRLIEELQKRPKVLSSDEEQSLRQRIHELERSERKKEHEIWELQKSSAQKEERFGESVRRCHELERSMEILSGEKKNLERCLTEASSAPTGASDERFSRPKASLSERGKRLGIFVDTQYLWYAAKHLQRKIDFQKLLDFVRGGRYQVKAVAYTVEIPNKDQKPFFGMLERIGFQVRSRPLKRDPLDGLVKADWDTGITVDIIHLVEIKTPDIIHLVGGGNEHDDLFRFLIAKGVKTEVSRFSSDGASIPISSVARSIPLGEEVFIGEGSSAVL